MCIDRHNGRTVYQHNFDAVTQTFDVVGDVDKKTVNLTMQRHAVTLTFTDNPIVPLSTAGNSAESPVGGKTIHAIWDSLRKTIGRIMDDSGQDEEQ